MTPEEVCRNLWSLPNVQEEAARLKKEEIEAKKAEKAEKKAQVLKNQSTLELTVQCSRCRIETKRGRKSKA
jgi:uncharacterized metal-binding protein YceD (DUF177 family)